LLLNLILLPLNINTINKDSNKYVEKINIESYSEKRGFGLKNIYKVAEVLLSDDIKEYNITSDGGSIVVRSIRDADNISNKKVFEVEQVELKNDGNFELKVNCYEDDMY
ncbi:MAG: hypothetical protein IJH34_00720, partial [Romboutsia sp.]|nr:hypothetical protein [Romboutsia sp.]